ncbi:MAG TPA: ABC transporter ATP-binding protein [Rugosimonospora sp.]|nr:ABC transporter ATP-binding protein [Rugosimonospora sp.]
MRRTSAGTRTESSTLVHADPRLDLVEQPFLDVVGLVKRYGSRTAVDGVTFRIAKGECFGLLGPNGAGKTTTILAVCGLSRPDAGSVRIGASPASPTGVQARQKIGYVPQDLAVYEDLSGRENLSFFGRLYGLRGRGLKDRVDMTLDFVDLGGRANDKVAGYSGGMKRRLNIAAALLHEPGIIILDEPTVGIDPQSRNAILENLLDLRERGVALLYTSHYMEEVERICDRIGIMDAGRILAEGSRTELIALLGDDGAQIRLSTSTTPGPALLVELADLAGVAHVTATDTGLDLSVRDVGRVLPGVVAATGRHGVQVNGVSVEQPDLETVFLHLTGKALRDV